MECNQANVLRAGQIIRHSKRKTLYQVIGRVQVDIDEKWVTCILYEDIHTGDRDLYARTDKNFHNFEVI